MRDGPLVSVTVRESDGPDERVDFHGRLVSFSFEDNANKADKCVFKLDNWDLRYLDDKTWRKGQVLEVSWGYDGNMHPPQRVVVKRVHGGTVLTIEGHAKSALLNREQRTRSFHNVARSDVVREIAKEYGFSGPTLHVEDTDKEFETISQMGRTDAWLLRRLARREGFTFYVDSTGLHWHDEEFDSAPTHVLVYYTDPGKGDIIDFNMDSDLFRQPGKVKVKGKDARTKKSFEVAGSDGDTERTELAGEIEVVDPRTGTTAIKRRVATESVHTTAAEDEREAKKEADARFKKASRRRVKLGLTIVGDPTLTAKRVIIVNGLGQYLSGKYYVAVSSHSIDGSGYLQKLSLKRGGPGKVAGGKGDRPSDKGKPNRKNTRGKEELFEKVDGRTGRSTFHRREAKGS